jgi:hypothetical protein
MDNESFVEPFKGDYIDMRLRAELHKAMRDYEQAVIELSKYMKLKPVDFTNLQGHYSQEEWKLNSALLNNHAELIDAQQRLRGRRSQPGWKEDDF